MAYHVKLYDKSRTLVGVLDRLLDWDYERRLGEATPFTASFPLGDDKQGLLEVSSFVEILRDTQSVFIGRVAERNLTKPNGKIRGYSEEIILEDGLLPTQYGGVLNGLDLADVAMELSWSRVVRRVKDQSEWTSGMVVDSSNIDTATEPGLVILAKEIGGYYYASGYITIRFDAQAITDFTSWERIRWASDHDDIVSTTIQYRYANTVGALGAWSTAVVGTLTDTVGVVPGAITERYLEVRINLSTGDTSTDGIGFTPALYAVEVICKAEQLVDTSGVPASIGKTPAGLSVGTDTTNLQTLQKACTQLNCEFAVYNGVLTLAEKVQTSRVSEFVLRNGTNIMITALSDKDEDLVNDLIALGPGDGINRLQLRLRDQTSIDTYGLRRKSEEFNDATDLADLTTKAQTWLDQYKTPQQAYTIVAAFLPGEEPLFQVGDLVQVADPDTHTVSQVRLLGQTRSYTSDGVDLKLDLGLPQINLVDAILDKTDPDRKIRLALGVPVGLRAEPWSPGIRVTVNPYVNSRAAGVEIYLSDVAGFTPDASNLYARGKEVQYVIGGLIAGHRYYVRARAYDDHGELSDFTSEVSTNAGAINIGDVPDGQIGPSKFVTGMRPVRIGTALPVLPDPANYLIGDAFSLYDTSGSNPVLYFAKDTDIDGIADTWVVLDTTIPDGSIDQAKLASGLWVPEIVGSLPTLPNASYPDGALVVLNTDWKLYRNSSDTWTSTVPTSDLTGSITGSQITDGAIGRQQVEAILRAIVGPVFNNNLESYEIGDWTVPGTDTLTGYTGDAYGGSQSGLFTSTATAPSSSGTTGTVRVSIDPIIAARLYGRRVRVGVWAKQPPSGASAEFAVALSTNSVGNSAWMMFTPTTSWQQFTFEYDVPAGPTSPTSMWLGVWADTSGGGGGVLIDQVSVIQTGGGVLAGLDQVTANEIAANTITAAQIAADTITAGVIAAGAIGTSELAADAVTATKILAGTITADRLAADTITAAQIAAGAIGVSELAADAVTAVKIAAGAVTADKIGAGEVQAGKLAVNAVIAGNIAAGAINATDILADGVITAPKIAAGAITLSDLGIANSNNLAGNPNFAAGDATHWGFTSPDTAVVDANFASGYAAELTRRDLYDVDDVFAVSEGETYFLSMRARRGEASTGLLVWPENFTQSEWITGSDASFTANQAAEPSPPGTGDTRADLYSLTALTGRQFYQEITGDPSGNTYTHSIYVKVKAGNGARTFRRSWTWVDGTGTPTGDGTDDVAVADDGAWHRITSTHTFGTLTNAASWYVQVFDVTGDITGDIAYIWGAKLEQAASASAYMPDRSLSIGLQSLDASGSTVNWQSIGTLLWQQADNPVQFVSGYVTIPANAVTARIWIKSDVPSGAGGAGYVTWHMSDIIARRSQVGDALGTSMLTAEGLEVDDESGAPQVVLGNIAGRTGVPSGYTYGLWGSLDAGVFVLGAAKLITAGYGTITFGSPTSISAGSSEQLSGRLPLSIYSSPFTVPSGKKWILLTSIGRVYSAAWTNYAIAEMRFVGSATNSSSSVVSFVLPADTYTDPQVDGEITIRCFVSNSSFTMHADVGWAILQVDA